MVLLLVSRSTLFLCLSQNSKWTIIVQLSVSQVQDCKQSVFFPSDLCASGIYMYNVHVM